MSLKEKLNTQDPSNPDFLEQQIYSIEMLLLPNLQAKKKKIKKSRMKILYALHLMRKHNERHGRTEDWFERKTLADMASNGVSVRSVATFINDEIFGLFGRKWGRWGEKNRQTSNGYELFDWVYQLFAAFERCGMMKKFKTDFDGWMEAFKKRLFHRFLPLIRRGHTILEAVRLMLGKRLTVNKKGAVNRLSTKPDFKLHGGQNLNCTPLQTPSGSSSYHPSKEGDLEHPVQGKSLFLERWREMEGVLTERYGIQGSDLFNIMKFNSLVDLDKGVKLRSSFWVDKKPKSQMAAMVYCLKKAKGSRKAK